MPTETTIVETRITDVVEVAGEAVVTETQAADVVEVGDLFGYAANTDRTYEHAQNPAASVWIIPHGFGKAPAVSVFDSTGREVLGDVTHNAEKTITTVTFSAAFSGVAYCN